MKQRWPKRNADLTTQQSELDREASRLAQERGITAHEAALAEAQQTFRIATQAEAQRAFTGALIRAKPRGPTACVQERGLSHEASQAESSRGSGVRGCADAFGPRGRTESRRNAVSRMLPRRPKRSTALPRRRPRLIVRRRRLHRTRASRTLKRWQKHHAKCNKKPP